MPPFQRDLLPVSQQRDSVNGVHVSTPSPKGSSNSPSSSKPGSTSVQPDSPANGPAFSTHLDSNRLLRQPSDEERSPPPHYSPTYVDRATQTSPLPPSPYSHDPYAHLHPYPVAYGYSYPYPRPIPWLPAPFPFSQPRGDGREASQRHYHATGVPNGPITEAGFPAMSHPLYAHYAYAHPPPPANLRPSISFGRQPQGASPLIAPLPQLPLPSPWSLPLVSEPPSPVVPLTAAASASMSTFGIPPTAAVHRRSISSPPALRAASPIENPFHSLYKSLRSLLLISEADPCFLQREVTGEQLVSVHGVGVWSYHGNTSAALETAKRTAFTTNGSYDAWLHAARARTAHYAAPGAVRPPLRWVLIEGGGSKPAELRKGSGRRQKRKKAGKIVLPDDALQTGTEANGEKLYCARAWWEGGLHPGKAGAHLQGGGAAISCGSLEHSLSTFEILVGDQQYAKWVDVPKGSILRFPPSSEDEKACPSDTNQQEPYTFERGATAPGPDRAKSASDSTAALPISFMPVEGGREANGEPLFVAQAEYERGWHPGKAELGEDHCCIAYGGGELWVTGFRVLGYII